MFDGPIGSGRPDYGRGGRQTTSAPLALTRAGRCPRGTASSRPGRRVSWSRCPAGIGRRGSVPEVHWWSGGRLARSPVDPSRSGRRTPPRGGAKRPSGSFLASLGGSGVRAGQGCAGGVLVYDLIVWRPGGEVEDLGQGVLGVGGLGEHPSGFRTAAGRGVDQDGFFDAGEVVEQFAY